MVLAIFTISSADKHRLCLYIGMWVGLCMTLRYVRYTQAVKQIGIIRVPTEYRESGVW